LPSSFFPLPSPPSAFFRLRFSSRLFRFFSFRFRFFSRLFLFFSFFFFFFLASESLSESDAEESELASESLDSLSESDCSPVFFFSAKQ
jgi:hypothetical protein